MNWKKFLREVGGLIFCLSILGGMVMCAAHKPNSNNPAVINAVTLLDAENTVNTIAHGLAEANQTLKNMQTTEPEYYAFAHPKLAAISLLNDKANADILAAKNGNTVIDWRKSVVAVASGAGDVASLTAFGFKNPKSIQLAQLGFATLSTALNLAATYGGK